METLDLRVLDLAREMMALTLLIAGPLLLVGLVVGLAVSVFQALTSVQEQTLSVVATMFSMAGAARIRWLAERATTSTWSTAATSWSSRSARAATPCRRVSTTP